MSFKGLLETLHFLFSFFLAAMSQTVSLSYTICHHNALCLKQPGHVTVDQNFWHHEPNKFSLRCLSWGFHQDSKMSNRRRCLRKLRGSRLGEGREGWVDNNENNISLETWVNRNRLGEEGCVCVKLTFFTGSQCGKVLSILFPFQAFSFSRGVNCSDF